MRSQQASELGGPQPPSNAGHDDQARACSFEAISEILKLKDSTFGQRAQTDATCYI